eukprot:TRINITY_DN70075_c0_g1_i1.p1 TRINITY_DN70075_c0_g1~~TRINITY_DN70075_c0_g1_i1.p1  ORF type:complete len:328 (-),score=51.20 TRINITY_DN70075_c0_g1_i1:17-1000(-)
MPPSERGNAVECIVTGSFQKESIPVGDEGVDDEPHAFALGSVDCPHRPRPRPAHCAPVVSLAEWLLLDAAILFKASRAPSSYAIERRVCLGTVLHHEPTGVLVWPSALVVSPNVGTEVAHYSAAPTALAAATSVAAEVTRSVHGGERDKRGHDIVFHYSLDARFRMMLQSGANILNSDAAASLATTELEPAEFEKRSDIVEYMAALRSGFDGSDEGADTEPLLCVALELPLVVRAFEPTAAPQSRLRCVSFAKDCRRRGKSVTSTWELAAPPTPVAPRLQPGSVGTTAGPFTRRLAAEGLGITRWNPQMGAWLAPREVDEHEEGNDD